MVTIDSSADESHLAKAGEPGTGRRTERPAEGPHVGEFTADAEYVGTPTAPPATRWFGRQPTIGFLMLLYVGIIWYVIGIVFGPLRSIETMGGPTTFWLPVLIVVAAWWHNWPGSLIKSRLGAGLVNTVIFIIAMYILTGVGQLIVEGHLQIHSLFESNGTVPTFPFLIPLAATIFVTMLQLTFVCARWPFDRMGNIAAGACAFVFVWVVGVVVNLTLINWDNIPAPVRHAIGLRNPGGPVNALDLIAWLVSVVIFQLIFFQVLDGWPFRNFESLSTQLVVSNVFVIGGGWLTYLFEKDVLHYPVPVIVAIGGAVAVGCNISTLAFESYPFHHEQPYLARIGLVMNVVGIAFVAYIVVKSVGLAAQPTWTTVPIELYVATICLNFIAPVIIFIYIVYGRWPFQAPALPEPDDALAR
jgi:hypothetical protein